jgi:hypothetical protein
MDPEMVTRTIQLIIAPVVMITSCCILGSGLLAHYSSIGERLRLTVRERVELLREMAAGTSPGLITHERLLDIDAQVPGLLHHHQLIRTSLAAVLIAILVFIVDMFTIAFSVLSNAASLSNMVLVVFMIGVTSLLIGVTYAVFDVYLSHKIFAYETRHAMSLEKPMEVKS